MVTIVSRNVYASMYTKFHYFVISCNKYCIAKIGENTKLIITHTLLKSVQDMAC